MQVLRKIDWREGIFSLVALILSFGAFDSFCLDESLGPFFLVDLAL